MFSLEKDDDVRKYVIRREIVKGEKKYTKAPKIQRLVTPVTLQRKRHLQAEKVRKAVKSREEAADYAVLLAQRIKEKREKKEQAHAKRRLSSTRKSSSN